jgi:predicted nucleic acid-binding protein
MTFVLDASVALSWYFTDEAAPTADVAFERLRTSDAVAPVLWWFEIRNALLASERRGRITDSQTAEILASLDMLPVRLDAGQRSDPILALARAYRPTFSAAAYLELARRLEAPLATLDRALAAGAQAAGVTVLGVEQA